MKPTINQSLFSTKTKVQQPTTATTSAHKPSRASLSQFHILGATKSPSSNKLLFFHQKKIRNVYPVHVMAYKKRPHLLANLNYRHSHNHHPKSNRPLYGLTNLILGQSWKIHCQWTWPPRERRTAPLLSTSNVHTRQHKHKKKLMQLYPKQKFRIKTLKNIREKKKPWPDKSDMFPPPNGVLNFTSSNVSWFQFAFQVGRKKGPFKMSDMFLVTCNVKYTSCHFFLRWIERFIYWRVYSILVQWILLVFLLLHTC